MKHLSLTLIVLVGLGVSIGLSGCGPKKSLLQDEPPVGSELQESSSGARVWESSPGILRQYDAFYVSPVTVLGSDKGRLTASSSRELNDLGERFREKVIHSLGSRHTMFPHPAKNVALVEITITNVWSNRAITNLRPGILVPNVLDGGATMESVFIDSVSQKPILKVWDSRSGERAGYLTGLTKWGGVQSAFDEWAILLSRNIRQSQTASLLK